MLKNLRIVCFSISGMIKTFSGIMMGNFTTADGKCMPMGKARSMAMELRRCQANTSTRAPSIKGNDRVMAQ